MIKKISKKILAARSLVSYFFLELDIHILVLHVDMDVIKSLGAAFGVLLSYEYAKEMI